MKELLRIPEVGLSGMYGLSEWSQADFESVLSVIPSAGVRLFPERWIPLRAQPSGSISPRQMADFSSMIRSLLWTWASSKVDLNEFIELAVESAANSGSKKFEFDDSKQKLLRERLHALFAQSNLLLSARASEAYGDVERPAKTIRVTSSVRPVSHVESSEVEAFLIAYNLQIEYLDGESEKSCFYSLDIDDLDDLIAELQNAKTAAGNVSAALTRAGFTVVLGNQGGTE